MPERREVPSEKIEIRGLQVATRIGVCEDERARLQRLSIDLSFGGSTDFQDATDQLDRTIDYSAVAEWLRSWIQQQEFRLLETLASKLLAEVGQRFPVKYASVTVRKFVLPDCESVGVSTERWF
ncbi:MAG: dihydroneopterin aldolase [Verrucomicrobia bacterium]|nr:dihydroneopterin aldolase [Verrucomicrobiota bacterium]